jgi:DNA ligase-associated metallophosphoesterase
VQRVRDTGHQLIDLAGEALLLHAERVVVWPARRTLLLADLHLGKSAFFRRSGLAVPEGSTREDFERLARLVREFAIERIVVLGDFVHAPAPAGAAHEIALARFRAELPEARFVIVSGNHDRRVAGRELVSLVEWAGPELVEPPFVFRHEPRDVEHGYVLSGHIHPVVHLRSGRDKARLPAFWIQPRCAVLPSFGSFTGGYEIEPAAHDQVFAAAAGRVWRVPAGRGR